MEDRVRRRGRHERLARAVVALDEAVDVLPQVPKTPESPASDRSLRDDVEANLDLIEPGPVGRRVVDVESRSLRKPLLDRGRPVRRVVVENQMVENQLDVEIFRDGLVDRTEETEELPAAVPREALADDSPARAL